MNREELDAAFQEFVDTKIPRDTQKIMDTFVGMLRSGFFAGVAFVERKIEKQKDENNG